MPIRHILVPHIAGVDRPGSAAGPACLRDGGAEQVHVACGNQVRITEVQRNGTLADRASVSLSVCKRVIEGVREALAACEFPLVWAPVRMARVVGVVVAPAVALLVTPLGALADAASPYAPGDPVGVPSGPTKDVFIEHEDLLMDLSGVSLVSGPVRPRARVIAKYILRNDGAARGIDLVFVTASADISDGEVSLDGKAVTATPGPLGPVPATWKAPIGTPPISPGPDIPYGVDRPAGLTFHIEMTTGRHSLETHYAAVPTLTSGDATRSEPIYWQLAFVLAPARQWEGFGDLDVTVTVPAGWPAAVRPELSRTGDALTGHFIGIPADAIGITTRMPLPRDSTEFGWRVGVAGLLLITVVAGLGLGLAIRGPWLLVAPVVAAPVSAMLLAIIVGHWAIDPQNAIPPAQQSWSGARGAPFVWLWEVLTALFWGFFAGQAGVAAGEAVGAAIRRRKARPQSKEYEDVSGARR